MTLKTKRPKLMIVGHARHGKDTVCTMLAKYGYKWVSSSWACGQIAVWPKLLEMRDKHDPTVMCVPYITFQEAFDDRANHRAFWFQCIKDYNTPDETRLAREIFADHDIYCGIRRAEELAACREQKVCDFTIWVDRSKHVGMEHTSSCTVRPFQADWTLDNNGTLEQTEWKIEQFYHGFLRPWEMRLANPEPTLPNHATQVTNG